jgi:hypothetical protein
MRYERKFFDLQENQYLSKVSLFKEKRSQYNIIGRENVINEWINESNPIEALFDLWLS